MLQDFLPSDSRQWLSALFRKRTETRVSLLILCTEEKLVDHPSQSLRGVRNEQHIVFGRQEEKERTKEKKPAGTPPFLTTTSEYRRRPVFARRSLEHAPREAPVFHAELRVAVPLSMAGHTREVARLLVCPSVDKICAVYAERSCDGSRCPLRNPLNDMGTRKNIR